jgi:hypothetical protein
MFKAFSSNKITQFVVLFGSLLLTPLWGQKTDKSTEKQKNEPAWWVNKGYCLIPRTIDTKKPSNQQCSKHYNCCNAPHDNRAVLQHLTQLKNSSDPQKTALDVTKQALQGKQAFVVDLKDLNARYYTQVDTDEEALKHIAYAEQFKKNTNKKWDNYCCSIPLPSIQVKETLNTKLDNALTRLDKFFDAVDDVVNHYDVTMREFAKKNQKTRR